jgi:hypothetical protein
VTDGIDLLAANRIVNRVVKVTVEEIDATQNLQLLVNGIAVAELDVFCTDPRLPRWEVNFPLPAEVADGVAEIEMRAGRRRIGVVRVTVESVTTA